MSKETKIYLSITLLFAFVIPQLVSNMHYIEYHDFSQNKIDSKSYFSTYKHHHICENQILKLHSFLTFDFPLIFRIPHSIFSNPVFNYSKTIIIKILFIHQNKRGPPLIN